MITNKDTDICIYLIDGDECGRPYGSPIHFKWTSISEENHHNFKCKLENDAIGFLKMRLHETERLCQTLPSDVYHRLAPIIHMQHQVLHMFENWPVHIDRPPEYEEKLGFDSVTIRVIQQMQWFTRQEYLVKFGKEPPMNAAVHRMLEEYADHPNFNPEWLR